MKIYLFIFFILVSGFAFSQRDILVSEQEKVIDSMEIEKIESLVDSIRLDKTLQKISIDSISLPGKFSAKEEFYKAEIFFRRDEIVKISLNPILPYIKVDISSSSIDYFLDHNKLIYICETFSDNSHPGLCGEIEKENGFYNYEDNLVEKVVSTCTHTCCEKFIEMNWLMDIYYQVYKISIEREID